MSANNDQSSIGQVPPPPLTDRTPLPSPADGSSEAISGPAASGPLAGTSATAVPFGSSTMTITAGEIGERPVTLRLAPRPHVVWTDGTVDNEGLNRKSSKRCCIYHKPRAFGESSTESSSEDEDSKNRRRRIARPKQNQNDGNPNNDFQRFHA
mmetsp:Transcript_17728/g.35379  ORF Transcript_17728/g.35379 Transcript_17728/m.35379 type:complete len:153 (+) Transcript_17728:157-615(+)|eukprot:CAMPEP_0194334636 /NCGR_PEP_ID=MMETSP0171-20130528/66785_1 /TAXON_ID=218684 /ORGANISM="Corethron pennatum, Strain L29A3" /LENGTH=152 /DNA_ID=CAMNT_0039097367 /DNA_START=44 /DNA_END=502 /DNA_ORIENTATION=+